MDVSQEQIQKNIEKLKNRIGDARTGGKGSQRRKVKVVTKNTGSNDKFVKSIAKKVGAQQFGVDEVNFFRDDNTILHFSKPETYASTQNNTFIVSGESETKTLKDLLPGIIPELGPKQNKVLKDILESNKETTEQEVPTLVETPENLDKVDE